MQTYLLALNAFSVAAFLLGLINVTHGINQRRLLPLFILVVSRGLILIITLTNSIFLQPLADTLDILSVVCIIWALINPNLSILSWPRWTIWMGRVVAFILVVTPLIPGWSIPFQIHNLLITMAGASIIFVSWARVYWPHLGAAIVLAFVNLVDLLTLSSTTWFIGLLAYTLLLVALYWDTLTSSTEKVASSSDPEINSIEIEQSERRLLEISQKLNSIHNLNQTMEHIAQVMAESLHTNQAAIFTLDGGTPNQAQLTALYSPNNPFHLSKKEQIILPLSLCPILQTTIQNQTQMVIDLPSQILEPLYTLWNMDQVGPTLLQPLLVQGHVIGVLLLGNPKTQHPIKENHRKLCHQLMPQLAIMIEQRRRYQALEHQFLIKTRDKQPSNTAQKPSYQNSESAVLQINSNSGQVVGDYETILSSMNDGIILADAKGRVQMINEVTEHLLSQPAEAIIDKPLDTVYRTLGITAHSFDTVVETVMERQTPLPIFLETAGRSIQGSVVAWCTQDQTWLGLITILRDVTREVKADQARDNFVTALSHQLRASLTTVKGYSELIIDGTLTQSTADLIEAQQMIHRSAERMSDVLDRASEMNGRNKNQVLPKFEDIDVSQLIEDVLLEITPLVRLRQLKLIQEIEPNIPAVMGDYEHLYRIINNLLTNACRFTLSGGQIILRAWVESDRSLRERNNTHQMYLHLSVVDTGIGIPTEEQSQIFSPFYQVEHPVKERKSGPGMGLFIVKKLVELHQGQVWVESIVRQGSTFHVKLPITQTYF
ncbi:MAG: ATP-binding protein [Chloroflexota bacterium]